MEIPERFYDRNSESDEDEKWRYAIHLSCDKLKSIYSNRIYSVFIIDSSITYFATSLILCFNHRVFNDKRVDRNHFKFKFIKLNVTEYMWLSCCCSQSARNENGVDLKLGRGQVLPKGYKIISGNTSNLRLNLKYNLELILAGYLVIIRKSRKSAFIHVKL